MWKAALPLLLLAGCQSGPQLTEPRIEIQRVEVPVPVPCGASEAAGPVPAMPDTEAAIRAAPNLFERVKLLMAGRELRNTWIAGATDAMRACNPRP